MATKKNVIDVLKKDHADVKKLFKHVVDAENFDDDESIKQICNMLTEHTEAEEKFVYPAAAKKIEKTDLVEEAKLEHADAKKIIKLLQTDNLDEITLKVKVEELKLMIEHHVEEEEEELFPQMEKAFSDDELIEMGQQVEAFKQEAKTPA